MCDDEPEHGDGDYYEMTMGVRVMVSKDYVNFGKLIAGVPATAANGFGGSDGYDLDCSIEGTVHKMETDNMCVRELTRLQRKRARGNLCRGETPRACTFLGEPSKRR